MNRAARVAAAGLALVVMASCKGAPPEDRTRVRGPIAAPEASLLAVPRPSLEGHDPPARELIHKREQGLEERIARHAAGAELAKGYGEMGRVYQAFGLFEAAAACYENAGRLEPQAFAWPYLLGRVQAELGRSDLAVEALGRALALQPANLPALVFLGDQHTTVGRLDDAKAAYREAIGLAPDCARAWSGLGQIALLGGDYRRAVEALEKALVAQPQASRIHYTLAQAYRRLGDAEKAERHLGLRGQVEPSVADPVLDGVLELNPHTLTQRGVEALQARRLGQAVRLLRAARDAFPENVEIRLQLAAALVFSGSSEEALVEYRDALRLQPQNPHVLYNLGTTLRLAGRDDEAVVHLRRAVELHRDYPEAQYNLAQTLRRLGRDAEAMQPLDEMLRLDPTHVGGRVARARLLARIGRCPEAIADVEQGLGILPGSLPLADVLARLLATCPAGQGRDAARALRLARSTFAAEAIAEHAATVALAEGARGAWPEARAWQQRALALLPEAVAAEERASLSQALGSYQERRQPELEW